MQLAAKNRPQQCTLKGHNDFQKSMESYTLLITFVTDLTGESVHENCRGPLRGLRSHAECQSSTSTDVWEYDIPRSLTLYHMEK